LMELSLETTAILAAGGSGKRMGGPIPKQLLSLGGAPVFARSIGKLENAPEIRRIVVAASADSADAIREWVGRRASGVPVDVVAGGEERQDTVLRALRAAPGTGGLVLVHDAVRPFVSVAKIRETIAAAGRTGAAILAVRPKATIKRGPGNRAVETLDRSRLWEVQTPQVFRRDLLTAALESAAADGFTATDDAALVERLGLPVDVVEGEETNIKITTPFDWMTAERLAAEGF
jgi:2-C-methyl-D-erythritol 4-phosphate cytidylyltransferase